MGKWHKSLKCSICKAFDKFSTLDFVDFSVSLRESTWQRGLFSFLEVYCFIARLFHNMGRGWRTWRKLNEVTAWLGFGMLHCSAWAVGSHITGPPTHNPLASNRSHPVVSVAWRIFARQRRPYFNSSWKRLSYRQGLWGGRRGQRLKSIEETVPWESKSLSQVLASLSSAMLRSN